MTTASRTWVRDIAALVLVAVACPVAFYGGVRMSCTADTTDCAFRGAAVIAPLILAAAGALAGLFTKGWPGLGFMVVGVIAGLASVPFLAAAAGNPVPIDPFSPIFAFFLCMPPVALGYGIARGLARLVGRFRSNGS
jgi:hypothetical protein